MMFVGFLFLPTFPYEDLSCIKIYCLLYYAGLKEQLFAWSDMVHGCMVYTELADMAAVSCMYTISVHIQKHAIKELFTHVESHSSAVSLLENGE